MRFNRGIILKEVERIYTAGNWSQKDDQYSEMFLMQNLKQFWMPEEISLSRDVQTWQTLTPEEQDVYVKVLAGLTLLDTIQGDIGMPSIAETTDSHQQKATLTFMGAMENAVHARSYSNIFLTIASQRVITEAFQWVRDNPILQRKAKLFSDLYDKSTNNQESSYLAKVASVGLESGSFYSGFFYPLYIGGQGKLVGSMETIQLIIRDESIHGVYVGLLAQAELKEMPKDRQEFLLEETKRFFDELIEIEIDYTRDIYDKVGLSHEVIDFVKYNMNKSLNNLGLESVYDHDKVNPIVLKGLNTGGTGIDFFSAKGQMYKKAVVESIRDEDFYFKED